MASKDVIGSVTKNLMPFLVENNYELVDVEFIKEGSNWFLRIFIDKDGGIAISDCEVVTRYINKYLDEEDPITQAYILEVSSPGIDRPLKKVEDYEKYKGKMIDIKLYKAIEKQKEFTGILNGLSEGIVSITDDEENVLEFALKDIASCKLAVIF